MSRSLRLSALALTVFVASVAVNPLAAHAFSNASLHGSYGCLGSVYFVIPSSSGSFSAEISAVEQLTFNGAVPGAVSGALRLQVNGEDCAGTVAPGSTYSVGSNGIGSLSLKLALTSDSVDGDPGANCSNFTRAFTPMKLDLVLQENGEQFSFAGQDDLASAPLDIGDTGVSFKGSCVSQTSS